MNAPILVYDSREAWFPVGVEESLEPYGYRWWDKAGVWEVKGQNPVTSGFHRLDFPSDMRQPDLPPVGYIHATRAVNLIWSQYWLWYLYNPWNVAGVGEHEGDWEMVQIATTDTGQPLLITGSQHHSGAKREAWACETRDGRPVIYVALGSHAHYFTPGTHGTDRCDGKGRVLDTIEWRDMGPWHSWPGRWGNSRGEGQSPRSPGHQGTRWTAPHLFHSQSHG